MRTLIGLWVLTTLALVSPTGMPLAFGNGPQCGPLSQQTCWEADNGKISGGREIVRRKPTAHETVGDSASVQSLRDSMIAAFCADAAANVGASGGVSQEVGFLCHGFAALRILPSLEEVLQAFRELGLYRGIIQTDPEDSTLVNLETYFWCGDGAGGGCDLVGEQEREVTLLGQVVRIRPRIISYAWDFGDGEAVQVDGGRAAHVYRKAGTVQVRLMLTWTADYAVGGGGFQAIGDTTTTTSPARAFPVREMESVVVGGG